MDFMKIEEMEQFIFRGSFVVRQVLGTKHEPALFPSLYEFAHIRIIDERDLATVTAHLSSDALLP